MGIKKKQFFRMVFKVIFKLINFKSHVAHFFVVIKIKLNAFLNNIWFLSQSAPRGSLCVENETRSTHETMNLILEEKLHQRVLVMEEKRYIKK